MKTYIAKFAHRPLQKDSIYEPPQATIKRRDALQALIQNLYAKGITKEELQAALNESVLSL